MANRTEPYLVHEHETASVALTAANLSKQAWPQFRSYIKLAVPSAYRRVYGTQSNVVEISVVEQEPFHKRELIVRHEGGAQYVETNHDSASLRATTATSEHWYEVFNAIRNQTEVVEEETETEVEQEAEE